MEPIEDSGSFGTFAIKKMNDVFNILIPMLIFIVWCLWMRFCFHYWIKRWAKKNSINLINHKICWFRRGPYWFTWLPVPGGPVYRITTNSTSGEKLSGWVWLSAGYFYGGNGKVTWDETGQPDQYVDSGQSNELNWKVFAKIIISIPVLFIVTSVFLGMNRSIYLKNAIYTDATITELIESKSDSGHTLSAPVYVFADQEGNEIRVKSATASYPPVGKVGDTIEVIYHPSDPHNSMENSYFSKWGLPTIFAILGTVLFIVCSIAYSIIKTIIEGSANQRVHSIAGSARSE